ncbi:MAG: MCP four helix bundle domain-containing protein, partial [Thermodesulfovibrio sp.]
MLKNITIGKKLMIGFGIIIFLLLLISAYTIIFIISVNSKLHDVDERIDQILYAAEIQREINHIHLKVRKLFIVNDSSKKQEIFKEIEEHKKYYRKKLEELDKITHSKEGKQRVQNLIDAINETTEANNKSIQLAMAGKNQEAIEIYLKEVESKAGNREKNLNELLKFYYDTANIRIKEMHDDMNMELIVLIIMTTLSTATAIFFGIFISRSVRNPVKEIKNVLEKVGKGDLSVDIQIKSKDELGMIANSVHEAILNIRKLVAESKTVSDSLASSSEQLSATTEQISRNLKSQTERASQIASAAEEMSQTVVDIAKNASQIAEVSVTTANVAREGRDMTMKTASEIRVIDESIKKLSEVIKVLGDRSRQIGEIVTVI